MYKYIFWKFLYIFLNKSKKKEKAICIQFIFFYINDDNCFQYILKLVRKENFIIT